MIAVKINGGLGNQMFQMALALTIRELGYDVKIDITAFNEKSLHNGYELADIFNIDIPLSNDYELKNIRDDKTNFISKVRRNIFGVKTSHIFEEKFNFDMLRDGILLDGYWQSEIYFKKNENVIKQSFQFSNSLENENTKAIELITDCNSIGLHVRRGDYINNPKVFKEYGQICDETYYNNAIEKIKELTNEPVFFVFSNDFKWAKKYLNLPIDTFFIDWNIKERSYVDMYLMSRCRHNIISNSSFSWWAAWLNDFDNKIVIAPKLWKISEGVNEWRTPSTWYRI